MSEGGAEEEEGFSAALAARRAREVAQNRRDPYLSEVWEPLMRKCVMAAAERGATACRIKCDENYVDAAARYARSLGFHATQNFALGTLDLVWARPPLEGEGI